MPVFVRMLFQILVMAFAACGIQGCQSQQEPTAEVDPVSKISMYDRVRLTLADADAVGIHLFDLKKLRADILTLRQTDAELSDLLLADLDRVEAVPETQIRDRVGIGREMYARFKKPTQ